MNGWALLNSAAWVASAILAVIILLDFVAVEQAQRRRRGARHDD